MLVYGAVLGWLCFGRRSKGRTVCLLGLSDAGKTLLYIRVSEQCVCVKGYVSTRYFEFGLVAFFEIW